MKPSSFRRPCWLGTFLLLVLQAQAADSRPMDVGIIGLDTSHAIAFTKLLNDPDAQAELRELRVVAAYPKGSRDIPSSVSRVPRYVEELRGMGVRIVDTIDELVSQVDAVLLETNDGRPHLEQLIPVLEAGKRVFVDKPVAGSLSDAVAMYQLASLYDVPIFSSSSLRYMQSAQEIRGGSVGKVLGASVYSPASLEPSHPDLFWYGIHGVETLFTVMGAGCRSVSRTSTRDTDVVIGKWSDERLGVFRGTRSGKGGYGGTAFGSAGVAPIGPYSGYRPLVVEISKFLRTGIRPVSDTETLEIYAFMEAADESKRRGGAPVALADVFAKAKPSVSRGLVIDAAYAGGNIVVEQVDGNRVTLRPDLRDTSEWWFYWNFRVRGAAGRTLTFEFAGRNPIGVRGPAVSRDHGESWSWLGGSAVENTSFSYTFSPDEDNVRFAFAIPYLQEDLARFLGKHKESPYIETSTLATSRRRRSIEKLRFGCLSGEPAHRVLLTARHHACESMANYALEGIIEEVVGDTDDGDWLRRHVEFLAIPFMDKDGVEEGDQGKLRRPHDHNRDYQGESIYPSVAVLRSFIPSWSDARLKLGLDLHCPWIRGGLGTAGGNEEVYCVGLPSEESWRRLSEFSGILADVQQGPLVYRAEHNLPFGSAWNTGERGVKTTSAHWMASLPGIDVATTIEIPYANAGGQEVNPESARALGHDLARAFRRWLAR